MTTEREQHLTDEWYRESLQSAREIGMLAIKTLITLNSGAIVVLLTFVANVGVDAAFTFDLASVKAAFLFFLGGLGCTTVLIAISYGVALTANPFTGKSNLIVFPFRWITPSYFILAFGAFLCFGSGVLSLALSISE